MIRPVRSHDRQRETEHEQRSIQNEDRHGQWSHRSRLGCAHEWSVVGNLFRCRTRLHLEPRTALICHARSLAFFATLAGFERPYIALFVLSRR